MSPSRSPLLSRQLDDPTLHLVPPPPPSHHNRIPSTSAAYREPDRPTSFNTPVHQHLPTTPTFQHHTHPSVRGLPTYPRPIHSTPNNTSYDLAMADSTHSTPRIPSDTDAIHLGTRHQSGLLCLSPLSLLALLARLASSSADLCPTPKPIRPFVCVKLCSKETPRSYLWTCDMLSIQAQAWGHHTNACEAMCDGGGQGWSPWCTCNQKWPFLQFLFHPKGQAVAGWSQVCAVGLNSIVSDSSPRSYLAMTEHLFLQSALHSTQLSVKCVPCWSNSESH